MNRASMIALCLTGIALCACDKLQQQGPLELPTYQSPTLDAARSISGSPPDASASAASSPAAK